MQRTQTFSLAPLADFPLLASMPDYSYLDSAATSQKPQQVLDAIQHFYTHDNANVHRGVHRLSDASTHAWQQSREVVAHFLGADPTELIVTRNTTEAINGVAYGWGAEHIKSGDLIVTTQLEHHANLVPWQEIARKVGANLELVPLLDTGELDMQAYLALLKRKPKLVAFSHVSNAIGTLMPVEWMTKQAHTAGARVLIDGAQSAPHLLLDFHAIGADFYAFSGHKMLGPMGVGGLLVKRELLDSNEMQPWLFGGGMISSVSDHDAQFHEDPQERFTAGTPDVASLVGLAAAAQYLEKLDMGAVLRHDQALITETLAALADIPQVHIVGPTNLLSDSVNHKYYDKKLTSDLTYPRVGSVTFTYQGVHAHDVAQVLDAEGVAVRSGHHCTMPLHTHCQWQATTRASFQVYSTREDIQRLASGLRRVAKVFA